MMTRRYILSTIVLVLLASVAVWACPSCKEAYEAGSKDAAIGESYSYSVVFFLGMFFTMLFGGTAFLSWKIKRAMRLRAAGFTIENH